MWLRIPRSEGSECTWGFSEAQFSQQQRIQERQRSLWNEDFQNKKDRGKNLQRRQNTFPTQRAGSTLSGRKCMWRYLPPTLAICKSKAVMQGKVSHLTLVVQPASHEDLGDVVLNRVKSWKSVPSGISKRLDSQRMFERALVKSEKFSFYLEDFKGICKTKCLALRVRNKKGG